MIPHAKRIALALAVVAVIAIATAFLWFVRGPWDVVWGNPFLTYLLWLVTVSATVLSLFGITLKEVFLGPVERPNLVPDFYVSRQANDVLADLFVTNNGTAAARNVVVHLRTIPEGLLPTYGARNPHTAELRHGGLHYLEWHRPARISMERLGPETRIFIRVECKDRTGRLFPGEEIEITGSQLLGKIVV